MLVGLDSNASWTTISLMDGLFQGHNLSSLLFCMGLKRALRRFHQNCDLHQVPCTERMHLEYIDDLLLKMRSNAVHRVMPLLEAALLTINLRLNRTKCKIFIPSAAEGD